VRVYLYVLAGLTSALIGWSLGQFFITDLKLLTNLPEIILFPCIAISLAVGMVLNEIFLSSPTRPKLNIRSMPVPVAIAAGLGLLAGLLAGALVQILFLPQLSIPPFVVRMLGWLCIGSSVGFAEGFTWRWRSIEAGNKRRFHQRFRTSIVAGSIASLLAALLFELLRLIIGPAIRGIAGIEDPLGFSILGILLGLAFSLTASPSYMVALRAGAGFEYVDRELEVNSVIQARPTIKNALQFISLAGTDQIEEGLSIQLPPTGKITIGSAANSDIYIPEMAEYAAYIELRERESFLIAKEAGIEINGSKIKLNQSATLKHNHILTFRVNQIQQQNNGEQKYGKGLYRFVYYNRFLDPQA
jgi:hypothetical protein